MSTPIASLKDDRLSLVRALNGRTGRTDAGACVLEGATLIEQAVQAGARLRFAVHADGEAVPSALAAAGVPLFSARASLLKQALRVVRPVGWVAVADAPASSDVYGDFAVVLDGVHDPGNLGTIARTAVGLGVVDLVCTSPEVDLTGRKTLDASRAAVLRARVHRYDTPMAAVTSLRLAGFEVVATSSRADLPQSMVRLRGGRVALVAGNETDGVSPAVLDAADHVVRIPMAGEVESLNVGVATGISLHELRARAVLARLVDHARGALLTDLTTTVTAMHRELDRGEGGVRPLTGATLDALVSLLAGGTADPEALGALTAEGMVADGAVTDRGRETVVALWTAYQRAEATALAGFSDEQVAQLSGFLARIRRNCRC